MAQKGLLVAMLAALAWGQQTAPAVVAGVVRGADGQPLPDSDVILIGGRCGPISGPPAPNQLPRALLIRSDAEGKFSFAEVLPSDCYTLQVSHSGYPPADYPTAGNGRSTFAVAAGQQLTGLTITLTRAILSGKVTGDDGEPIPGVRIRPILGTGIAGIGPQILFLGSTVTDEKGAFSLSELSFGRYILAFSMPFRDKPAAANQPELDYIDTYYPGVADAKEAKSLLVTPGAVVEGLNLHLNKVPVFHVRGKVTGLPGNVNAAANEVRVVLAPPSGDLYSTQTNPSRRVAADGSFDYCCLPAGDYSLSIAAHDFVLYRKPLRLADRNVDNLAIVSQIPADLNGTIRTIPDLPLDPSTGKALGMPGSVRFVPDDPIARPVTAKVYPDGTFTANNLGASRYFVEADPPNGGYLKSVLFAGHEVVASGLDFIHGTGKGALQLAVSLEGGRIVGSVKKEDGQPASDAMAIAIGTEGRPSYHEMPADKSGEFVFKLAPGKYRLYVLEGARAILSDAASMMELLRPLESLSVPATVADGEKHQVSLVWITNARLQEEIRRRR